MKYKKKFQKEIKEEYRHIKTLCDICDKDINWDEGSWDNNQIEINARIGSTYPEADCRTQYEMDLCRTCFVEKVLPELIKLGHVSNFSSEDSRLEKMEEITEV